MTALAAALSPAMAAAALVLSAAGVAKLRSPGAARRALSAAGWPARRWIVRALGAGEVALGAWCVITPSRPGAGALAAAYLGFALVAVRLSRRRAACGCFGESDAPASPVQAGLSALLGLIAALCVLAPPHGLGWMVGHGAWVALVLLAGVAAAAYGLVLVYTELARAWTAWGGR